MAKSKKNVTPYGDRVLVKPEDKISKTAGGIIIPDTVIQRPSQGTVFKVGDQCTFAKVGDVVMFGKESGIPLNLGEEGDVLLLREAELMLKVENPSAK